MRRPDASSLGKAAAPLDAICDALVKERPLALLLLCSFAAACAFCFFIFDVHFLLGTSAFWDNPRGIVKNGWADISTELSGYFFFQRDRWQWPLFHVDKFGGPQGLNVIFTSTPWVVLAGRIAFLVTGTPVNLYGLWTAVCFVASATTMTKLVATLGQRNIAAATMATIAGLSMPALLARWGHMSLMAQFEIPLTLIFYLRYRRSREAWRMFVQGGALMWLALWTHAYLFVMIASMVLATILQARSNRALRDVPAAAVTAALAIGTGIIMALSGYTQSGGSLDAEGLGAFSMNLLSPFVPQRSGLFPVLRDVMADATGRQYEGFSYLGAGLLMLVLMTLPWQARKLREGLRHNPWIGGLFLCFTLFAVSHIIYLGTLRVVEVPLPASALQFAAMFRSTGRFFWPVMYSIAALAIAAPVPFYGRYGALLLCLAMPLQWLDAAPLREAMMSSVRTPEKPHIDLPAWEAAIHRHESVRVLPQYSCLGRLTGWNHEVAVQVQLLAARAVRPINTAYAARFAADCRADQKISGMPRPGARQLSVFLDKFSGFTQMQKFAATDSQCRAGRNIVVCSDVPAEGPALVALARTDGK